MQSALPKSEGSKEGSRTTTTQNHKPKANGDSASLRVRQNLDHYCLLKIRCYGSRISPGRWCIQSSKPLAVAVRRGQRWFDRSPPARMTTVRIPSALATARIQKQQRISHWCYANKIRSAPTNDSGTTSSPAAALYDHTRTSRPPSATKV